MEGGRDSLVIFWGVLATLHAALLGLPGKGTFLGWGAWREGGRKFSLSVDLLPCTAKSTAGCHFLLLLFPVVYFNRRYSAVNPVWSEANYYKD